MRIAGPKRLLELFAGDQLSRTPHQKREDPRRLPRQPHAAAVFEKLPRLEVEFEDAKANDCTRRLYRGAHPTAPLQENSVSRRARHTLRSIPVCELV